MLCTTPGTPSVVPACRASFEVQESVHHPRDFA
jgi:hypothetical protein